MKPQRTPYPLRMEEAVRVKVEKLAADERRSLNWQLNELVKMGLAGIASQNEKTLNDAGKQ
jgi:hypothetical protein